jgi:hypothetical protein
MGIPGNSQRVIVILCRTRFIAHTERLESFAFVGCGFAANNKKLSVDPIFADVFTITNVLLTPVPPLAVSYGHSVVLFRSQRFHRVDPARLKGRSTSREGRDCEQ